MDFPELATAVRENLPIKIFILNNKALGMVKQWQSIFYNGRFSQTLQEEKTDFSKLSEAFGATSFLVTNAKELSEAVDKAFKTDGVCVVDCRISEDENVLPMIPPNGSLSDIIM
jgi:acetolactate synthase-1/2/3 large subunit